MDMAQEARQRLRLRIITAEKVDANVRELWQRSAGRSNADGGDNLQRFL
jgi:hypothetical protein